MLLTGSAAAAAGTEQFLYTQKAVTNNTPVIVGYDSGTGRINFRSTSLSSTSTYDLAYAIDDAGNFYDITASCSLETATYSNSVINGNPQLLTVGQDAAKTMLFGDAANSTTTSSQFLYSTDGGKVWTRVTTPSSMYTTPAPTRLADGRFLVVSANNASSVANIGWYRQPGNTTFGTYKWATNSLNCAMEWGSNIYVFGSSGAMARFASTELANATLSGGPTVITGPFGTDHIVSCANNGATIGVATTQGGLVAYSNNGTGWALATLPAEMTGISQLRVIWNGSRFVMTGNGGIVGWSTNGYDWFAYDKRIIGIWAAVGATYTYVSCSQGFARIHNTTNAYEIISSPDEALIRSQADNTITVLGSPMPAYDGPRILAIYNGASDSTAGTFSSATNPYALSTDYGATWTRASNIDTNSQYQSKIVAFCTQPSNSDVMLAAVNNNNGSHNNGIHRSTDGGVTWNFRNGNALVTSHAAGTHHMALTDSGFAMMAAHSNVSVLYSTNAGVYWASGSSGTTLNLSGFWRPLIAAGSSIYAVDAVTAGQVNKYDIVGGALSKTIVGTLGVTVAGNFAYGDNLLGKFPTAPSSSGFGFYNVSTTAVTTVLWASLSAVLNGWGDINFYCPTYDNGKFYVFGRRGYYYCSTSNLSSWTGVRYPAPFNYNHASTTKVLLAVPHIPVFLNGQLIRIIDQAGNKLELVET